MKRLRKLSRATTRSTPLQKPRMQQEQRRTKQPRNKGRRPAVEATDSRAAILVPPKLDWRVLPFPPDGALFQIFLGTALLRTGTRALYDWPTIRELSAAIYRRIMRSSFI